MRGTVDFEIIDPETEESLLPAFGLDAAAFFTVEAAGCVILAFHLRTPNRAA